MIGEQKLDALVVQDTIVRRPRMSDEPGDTCQRCGNAPGVFLRESVSMREWRCELCAVEDALIEALAHASPLWLAWQDMMRLQLRFALTEFPEGDGR